MFDLFVAPILYLILFYLSSLVFIYLTIGYDKISVYLSRTGMFAWTLIAMVPNFILAVIILIRGLFTMTVMLVISVSMFFVMLGNTIYIKFVK